jgi:tetratricopeptide (TPR) repeat protein
VNDAAQRAARLAGYLASDPHNPALVCDLHDAHLAAGDPAAAEAVLAALPDSLQAQPGIRFRRARGALVAGRFADAATLLKGLIAEGIEDVALWHDLAFAHLCLREQDDAARTVADARARFADTVELAIVAARVALLAEDMEQALAETEHALALAPQHPTAMGLRALILFDAGQHDAAAQAADACLILHPDQHEARLAAGNAALHAQRWPQAEGHFTRALSRHANSGRALLGFGQCQMTRGDLAGGRETLEQAARAMPDHIGTWHALAWAQLLTGDTAAAEASYRKAYDIDRNFGDSHGGLALIDALAGRREAAEQGIKRALRLAPMSATALYAQAVLLEDGGQGDAAGQQVAELLKGRVALPSGVTPRQFARDLMSRLRPGR